MSDHLLVVQPFGRRLGGSDNILLSVLRQLDRTRLEPTVAFLERGPFVDEVAKLGIRTHALPGGRLRNPGHLAATIARLTRIMRQERPDVIMNWLSTAQLYGGPAAVMAGMSGRCIWWQLDQHTGGFWSRGRWLDRIATAIPARAVGCCSAATAESQAHLWPHRKTLSVLPGIPPPADNDLPRSLSLPEDAIVVGTVGRLFAWKGHHRLLEAVAQLRANGANIHVLVVGGGGHRGDERYEAELRELADDPRLRGHVTFTGQVAEAAPYFRLLDVFVNASSPEPFGLVLLEAMAAGLPVVAVDAGGPREIVVHGETGLLAPSGSPADLAAQIRVLADDPQLRRRLGDAGRERYVSRFGEERMGVEMTNRLVEYANS